MIVIAFIVLKNGLILLIELSAGLHSVYRFPGKSQYISYSFQIMKKASLIHLGQFYLQSP
jgi:hypothetical protein